MSTPHPKSSLQAVPWPGFRPDGDGAPNRVEPPLSPARLADAIEPALSLDDLVRLLNGSRRSIERMKSAGKLPKPDFYLGRMPRWWPATIRGWIKAQAEGRGGRRS